MQNLWRCRCRRVVDLKLPISSMKTLREDMVKYNAACIDKYSFVKVIARIIDIEIENYYFFTFIRA